MITRKPRAAISAAWPKRIQLVSALEKRPWRSTTALPSPSSCQTSSAPSYAVKRWLIGELPGGFDPAVDKRLILLGSIFRQAFGVDPGAVQALRAAMVLGSETRRSVERAAGEVHILAVGESEAERGAAFPAVGPMRDRRGNVVIGLGLPGDVALLHVLARDRDGADGALAHPAMA